MKAFLARILLRRLLLGFGSFPEEGVRVGGVHLFLLLVDGHYLHRLLLFDAESLVLFVPAYDF